MAETEEPTTDFDLDEDLFNFDEVLEGGPALVDSTDLDEIFASLDEPADEELPAPEPAPEPEPEPAAAAEPEPAAAPAPAPAPAEAAPAPAPVAAAAPAEVAGTVVAGAPPPTVVMQPVPQSGVSKSVLLVIGAATLANSMVAFVAMRSNDSIREDVREGMERVTTAAEEMSGKALEEFQKFNGTQIPMILPDPDNAPVFETAREEIQSGRYAEARQRLYAFLAIIDRHDAEEATRLEEKANFLIAEANHLEAIVRGGDL